MRANAGWQQPKQNAFVLEVLTPLRQTQMEFMNEMQERAKEYDRFIGNT